ncbi:MAG: Gfo/Idh/MocA family oxidoreductase [Pseudomonadales bacterium]
MSSGLRAAVVGVGYLGRFHAMKYAMLDDVELLAVVDVDAERARQVGAEVGADWLTSHRDLVGQVDLVSVATPTATHFEITRDFLQAGTHVLVEKPIASTVAQANALIELASTHECVLQPGHIERFNPAWRAIREHISQPLLIKAQRLAPFGPRGTDLSVVLDLMIHDLDLILSIVASEPVRVRASGMHLLTRSADVCSAHIEFANGCVAEIVASRVSAKASRKMHVYQQHDDLAVDFRHQRIRARLRRSSPNHSQALEQPEGPPGDALLSEIQAFTHAVRAGAAPLVSGEDGLSALALALEIERCCEASILAAAG